MHNNEYVDITEIKKVQKRYQDSNLYSISERKEAKKISIEKWRHQMKAIEDKRAYRKMYDRVGKDTKTLIQERD